MKQSKGHLSSLRKNPNKNKEKEIIYIYFMTIYVRPKP